jgi:hypothetical protein
MFISRKNPPEGNIFSRDPFGLKTHVPALNKKQSWAVCCSRGGGGREVVVREGSALSKLQYVPCYSSIYSGGFMSVLAEQLNWASTGEKCLRIVQKN